MRKNNYLITFYLILASVTISFSQVGIQDPPKPLISKATATWCNICGSAAWDNFHDLITTHSEEAVFMAIHADDGSDLYSETAKIFSENFIDFFGVPELYHGRDPAPFRRIWANSTKEYIDEFNAQERTTQTDLSYEFIDNIIRVQANIKFVQDEDHPRYLSLFLIEDAVVAYQFNQGPRAIHSKILRTHITPEVFENLISTEPIKANEELSFEFSKELQDNWKKDNIEVALIVWKKFGDKFQVINSRLASAANTTTPTRDLSLDLKSFSVTPNLIKSNAQLSIVTKEDLGHVTIDIFNEVGQRISTLHNGLLKSGKQNISLDRSTFPTAGIYYISLNNGSEIISKRVVVK